MRGVGSAVVANVQHVTQPSKRTAHETAHFRRAYLLSTTLVSANLVEVRNMIFH